MKKYPIVKKMGIVNPKNKGKSLVLIFIFKSLRESAAIKIKKAIKSKTATIFDKNARLSRTPAREKALI